MASLAVKRIQNELKDLEESDDPPCKLELVDNSMSHLRGQIVGPKGTPYEGGTYELSFEIPDGYPFSPPKVKFITKIWHPNISSVTGSVCLEIDSREDSWSSILTLRTVMLSLQALMSAPEPDDPQDAVVASQYKKNKEDFEQTAQYWAQKYAGAKPSGSKKSNDDLVKKMMEMGISEEGSVKSLSKSSWNLEAAIKDLK